jgi:hypothetical protein
LIVSPDTDDDALVEDVRARIPSERELFVGGDFIGCLELRGVSVENLVIRDDFALGREGEGKDEED